jgi:hypothetical protein
VKYLRKKVKNPPEKIVNDDFYAPYAPDLRVNTSGFVFWPIQ